MNDTTAGELSSRLTKLEEFERKVEREHLLWFKRFSWLIIATTLVFIGLIASFAWSASGIYSTLYYQKEQIAELKAELKKARDEAINNKDALRDSQAFLLDTIWRGHAVSSFILVDLYGEYQYLTGEDLTIKTHTGEARCVFSPYSKINIDGVKATKNEFSRRVTMGYKGIHASVMYGVILEINLTQFDPSIQQGTKDPHPLGDKVPRKD